MELALIPLTWAVVSCGIAWMLLWVLEPLAGRWGLVDRPKGRKDHSRPTPVVGGLAIAGGSVIAGLTLLGEIGNGALAFSGGASLLLLTGLLDDKYDLRWQTRVAVQVLAALTMVYFGGVRVEHLGPVFGLSDFSLGWASVPFTVFATVGLINAVNMIDGSDGLAGSLVLVCLLMLTAASIYAGNWHFPKYLMIVSGALVAFLWFNARLPGRTSARVFLGNAGSALLGYTIAWFAFRLTQNPGHPVSPALALWMLPIPVMDCLVVMIRRMRLGRSPFSADHGHIHHFLREAGFNPLQKSIFLGGVTALMGLAAGQALRLDIPEPVLVLAFVAMCLGWYAITAKRPLALAVIARLRVLVSVPGRGAGRAAGGPASGRGHGS